MDKIKKIEKPWGHERWLEVNKDYVVKELFMKSGHSCSLQYHEKKHETFYLLSGKLKFYVGTDRDNLEILFLNPSEHYTIPPLLIHRMEAVVDSIYLEASTNFLEDIVRIEDKYGRK
tara:strand:+ start:8750 stop:9100 length:351 start_codon:yes stop_codon:yes gene_type:complete